MDVEPLQAALRRLDEGLQEARAAAEMLREGDANAMADLDEVVDAMAREIAEIKSKTSTSL